MSNAEKPSNRLQLRSGPLITAAALAGAGALLALARAAAAAGAATWQNGSRVQDAPVP